MYNLENRFVVPVSSLISTLGEDGLNVARIDAIDGLIGHMSVDKKISQLDLSFVSFYPSYAEQHHRTFDS